MAGAKSRHIENRGGTGKGEHVVCRHLEFEGIVVNTSSTCRETVKIASIDLKI